MCEGVYNIIIIQSKCVCIEKEIVCICVECV